MGGFQKILELFDFFFWKMIAVLTRLERKDDLRRLVRRLRFLKCTSLYVVEFPYFEQYSYFLQGIRCKVFGPWHIWRSTQGSNLVILKLYKDGNLLKLFRSDLLWNSFIMGILQRKIALITANAFVSTLGGGHFLCKQLEHAEKMALEQLRIANQLGDPVLASQCRIHLSYNMIQRGRLAGAKYLLLSEWRFMHRTHKSSLVKSMIQSAWLYIKKLKRIQKELSKKHPSELKDEFYRQRFLIQ